MLDFQYNQEAEFRVIREEAKLEGILEERKKAEAKAEADKLDKAKKMVQDGLSEELVERYTGLPEDKVKEVVQHSAIIS